MVFSISLGQPLQSMFASSLHGVLAGSSASKHFQRGVGSERAVCGFCEDFFSPLPLAEHFPKLHALIPRDKFALDPPQHVTLALLGGKEHRPFIFEEGKSETYRKGWIWSTPQRSHPLSYTGIERCRGNLRHNSMSLRLCISNFNSSKNKPAFLCQNSLVHLFNFKEANT